jgi:voltage-gated potassium channel
LARSDRVLNTDLDRALAPMMFWVSFTFLVLAAGVLFSRQLTERLILHELHGSLTEAELREDLPSPFHGAADSDGTEQPGGLSEPAEPAGEIRAWVYFVLALAAVWPLFWFEWFLHWATGGRFILRRLLYCFCPPLRMGMRDHVDARSIWLPRIGWSPVDFELQSRIERAFSGPMIMMALAVLPLLGLEYYPRRVFGEPTWHIVVTVVVGETIIWIAFALELIIMLSIVPKKFRYCREHWVDIAIVCLPLIGFLRILRFGRMLRLHHVTKVGRVYRLRGVGLRMFRGILVLDVIRKIIEGDPERRLGRLREQLVERELEVRQLQEEIRLLEEKVKQRDEVHPTMAAGEAEEAASG